MDNALSRVIAALSKNKAAFMTYKKVVIEGVNFGEYLAQANIPTEGDLNVTTNINVQCPFHDTETFDAGRVSKREGGEVYFCNNPTCSAHGKGHDIISFHKMMMEKNGETTSYTAALVDLYANYLGKGLPDVKMPELSPEEKAAEKDRHLTNLLFLYITNIAEKLLADPQLGATGRKYLEGRKISKSTIQTYHIGYIPSGYHLSEDLIKKGFPADFLTKKGILSKSSGKDTLFDRIVIPMWDTSENPLNVDFSFKDSRVPNLYTRMVTIKNEKDKAFKHRYINRELPFFNIKSCFGKKNIILVEGIVDCLSLQQVLITLVAQENMGVNFAVSPSDIGVAATYGTNGLSEKDMQKYLGGFNTIYLAADNDLNGAGQTANIKRSKILKEMFPKATIKLVSWSNKDANDMLVSGAEPTEFMTCIQNAISPEQFCIKTVCDVFNRDRTLENNFKLMSEVKNILSTFDTSDTLRTYRFAQYVSKKCNIPIEVILFEILRSKLNTSTEILAAMSEIEKMVK